MCVLYHIPMSFFCEREKLVENIYLSSNNLAMK